MRLTLTQLESRDTPAAVVQDLYFCSAPYPEGTCSVIGHYVSDDGTGGDVRLVKTPHHLIVKDSNGVRRYDVPFADWTLMLSRNAGEFQVVGKKSIPTIYE